MLILSLILFVIWTIMMFGVLVAYGRGTAGGVGATFVTVLIIATLVALGANLV